MATNSPEKWGPYAWYKFHIRAMKYPTKPCDTEVKEILNFYHVKFFKYIRCEYCRKHYQTLIKNYPIRTNSGLDLFAWTVDIHNCVNAKLKKMQVGYNEAYHIWWKALLNPQNAIRKPILNGACGNNACGNNACGINACGINALAPPQALPIKPWNNCNQQIIANPLPINPCNNTYNNYQPNINPLVVNPWVNQIGPHWGNHVRPEWGNQISPAWSNQVSTEWGNRFNPYVTGFNPYATGFNLYATGFNPYGTNFNPYPNIIGARPIAPVIAPAVIGPVGIPLGSVDKCPCENINSSRLNEPCFGSAFRGQLNKFPCENNTLPYERWRNENISKPINNYNCGNINRSCDAEVRRGPITNYRYEPTSRPNNNCNYENDSCPTSGCSYNNNGPRINPQSALVQQGPFRGRCNNNKKWFCD